MWPSSLIVLVELLGEFLGDLTYSESPSLSPELAANVTSLFGLAGIMFVVVGLFFGCAQF